MRTSPGTELQLLERVRPEDTEKVVIGKPLSEDVTVARDMVQATGGVDGSLSKGAACRLPLRLWSRRRLLRHGLCPLVALVDEVVVVAVEDWVIGP